MGIDELRNSRFVLRIKVRVHEKGATYFPDELRNSGFVGDLEGIPNAYAILLLRPGVSLRTALGSLDIIKRDIEHRISEGEA